MPSGERVITAISRGDSVSTVSKASRVPADATGVTYLARPKELDAEAVCARIYPELRVDVERTIPERTRRPDGVGDHRRAVESHGEVLGQ